MEYSYHSIHDFLEDTGNYNVLNCLPTVCHLNARSIRNKFDDIELLVRRLKFPNVLVISKIWLWPCEEKFYNLDNYQSILPCYKVIMLLCF
ncbi:hypothetical protein C0J52_16816 [Blattella germanica]|nr:hypothetical protein C0J52_16816 [Blattella germanica]